jgi:NAD-dependent DNA ligase
MLVRPGVSGKLDILVLAHPASRSGKAKKADELGVRKMAEPVFWRAPWKSTDTVYWLIYRLI